MHAYGPAPASLISRIDPPPICGPHTIPEFEGISVSRRNADMSPRTVGGLVSADDCRLLGPIPDPHVTFWTFAIALLGCRVGRDNVNCVCVCACGVRAASPCTEGRPRACGLRCLSVYKFTPACSICTRSGGSTISGSLGRKGTCPSRST